MKIVGCWIIFVVNFSKDYEVVFLVQILRNKAKKRRKLIC